jgi:hypothetical protein
MDYLITKATYLHGTMSLNAYESANFFALEKKAVMKFVCKKRVMERE